VTSPTFVLVNEYRGVFRLPRRSYRLQESGGGGLGGRNSSSGRDLLEWAEKIPEILPEERIEVRISWIGPGERRFLIAGKGARANSILLAMRNWEKEN
jgi:tRNA threonylcarbamoyladenosine biosynthesis protein TsaE